MGGLLCLLDSRGDLPVASSNSNANQASYLTTHMLSEEEDVTAVHITVSGRLQDEDDAIESPPVHDSQKITLDGIFQQNIQLSMKN